MYDEVPISSPKGAASASDFPTSCRCGICISQRLHMKGVGGSSLYVTRFAFNSPSHLASTKICSRPCVCGAYKQRKSLSPWLSGVEERGRDAERRVQALHLFIRWYGLSLHASILQTGGSIAT